MPDWTGDQRPLAELLREGLAKSRADFMRAPEPQGPVIVSPYIFRMAVRIGIIDEHGRRK